MNIFRFGLIARIALLVVCVELVAFGALAWFYANHFTNAMQERTYARLHLIGDMLANGELAISALSRKQLMSDMLGARYLSGMAIGGSGFVIVSTNPAYLGRPARDIPGFNAKWLTATTPNTQLLGAKDTLTTVMHVHASEGGMPLYTTVLTISTADLNAMKHTIVWQGLLGSLLFILLTSAAIVLIAQRLITQRVATSLAVLKNVEGGALEARIPVSSPDELGQLQTGINSMTEKLGTLLVQHRTNAEELRKQKDLLNSIIQHAPIRVFWKDRDSRYAGGNTQFAYDAGLSSSDELIGKDDFDMCWRDHAESYRADDQAIMESGIPKLEYEETQTTPDGRAIWISTSKVPLRDEHDQIVGVLGIYTDITARKQAEEQIRNLAYFDPLTTLPNRRLLLERLQQSMSASLHSGEYGALLMLDLDNFKDLNDSQGHDVGDNLLIQVAARLRGNVNWADTVARIGGDEYVIITDMLGTDEAAAAVHAEELAETVRIALYEPFELKNGDLTHYNTSSIGVTLYQGNAEPVEMLLKQADVALYQAKNAGRNAIRFFNVDMQTAIDKRAHLATGLRNGLASNELRLYYQPQVDLNGKLIGAEALLRWLPQDGAPISPGVFIPLAEETGLILPIGEWVFEQTCIQLKQWEALPQTRSLTLAVNISALQFRQPDFVEIVSRQVTQSGIDPTKLKLEITESVVLSHVDEVIDNMQRLKQLGIAFSLDDFGTGFSSLSYLKRLPIDQLKIDQSFVHDIMRDKNDAAIVRAILAISKSLGINVVAEGVETAEQRDFLLQHGCKNFQGYLFGRPLPMDEWPQSLFDTRTIAS